MYASNASGQSEIVMRELLLGDLKELVPDCESKTFGIGIEQAQALIESIAADIGAKIGYNLYGDGSSYSCSFSSQRYHSCVSWAMDKLAKIDCLVEGTWHDFGIKITSKIIPGYEEKEKADACCIL